MSYESYQLWKEWERYFECQESEDLYFESELAEFQLSGLQVLEIGFGRGSFMAWVKQKGADVEGVEINNYAIEQGVKKGFKVSDYDYFMSKAPVKSFDLVVAFDVFEHLEAEELKKLLLRASKLLKENGKVLARFPNGLSPFGRLYQHGDVTHIQTVTPLKLSQLLLGSDMVVSDHRNPAIPIRGEASVTSKLRHRIRLLIKYLVSKAISKVYGGTSVLDPNTIVVLSKKG